MKIGGHNFIIIIKSGAIFGLEFKKQKNEDIIFIIL